MPYLALLISMPLIRVFFVFPRTAIKVYRSFVVDSPCANNADIVHAGTLAPKTGLLRVSVPVVLENPSNVYQLATFDPARKYCRDKGSAFLQPLIKPAQTSIFVEVLS